MSLIERNEGIQAAIEKARLAVAARTAIPSYGETVLAEARAPKTDELVLNTEQQMAVDLAVSGESFCFIGPAGSGKTTTTKALIKAMMQSNKLPTIERNTKYLQSGRPGVVLIAYTRRAVRNIAKQMPDDFKPHCITYHKLVEYEPEVVETEMPDGRVRVSKPFLPQRKPTNPLPRNLRLVIVDEASMLSIDFYKILSRALPSFENVQFIFIGDINQLPPVYGDGILGIKLNQLRTVELTQIYRQALESPIIELALQVKDNKIPQELRVCTKDYEKITPRGKVTIVPWKKLLKLEDAEHAIHLRLQQWVRDGTFNYKEDVILCPWGKSFGTINMNKSIGTQIARMNNADVYEIIAGFNKHYFSVGDRVMFDKRDAEVVKIARNMRYIGKHPQPASPKMDYWGWGSDASASLMENLDDIDALLDSFADAESEDRSQESSHAMTIKFLDDEIEYVMTKSGEFNVCDLGYAMSVHKSQGSEWRRVFIITHDVHIKMLQRELLYTAITRASEELYIIMPPTMLVKAASRARIKGVTLAEKIKYFAVKHAESDLEDYEDH